MKVRLEYPWPVWTDREKEYFDDITMLDIAFQTTLHYFKNHDTGFEQLLIKVLGFGIRITRNE